jgi:type IX secretion system PorP/SprF family membrane protein
MRFYMLRLIFVIIGLIYSVVTYSQVNYGQYFEYMGYINPSYSGYIPGSTFNAQYRSADHTNEFVSQTVNLAIDVSLKDSNSGLSFIASDDVVGAEGSFSAYANYSYRVKLSEASSYLAFGLGAGILQNRLNVSKFIKRHPDDSELPNENQYVYVPDVRAGISYISDVYFLGFATDHLLGKYLDYANAPDIIVGVSNPCIYLNGAMNINVGESNLLRPRAAYISEINTISAFDMGGYFLFKEQFGVSIDYRKYINHTSVIDYSNSNRFFFGINCYVEKNLRIGIDVDYLFNTHHNTSSYNMTGVSFSVLYNLTKGAKNMDDDNSKRSLARYF